MALQRLLLMVRSLPSMVVSVQSDSSAPRWRLAADAANIGVLHDLRVLGVSRRMGTFVITATHVLFPNVVREAETMVFLYEGDASYESGDLSLRERHRTLRKTGIFITSAGSEITHEKDGLWNAARDSEWIP